MKRICSILLSLVLLTGMTVGINTAYADGTDDFRYKRAGGGVTITGYYGTDKDVVIPDTIDGYSVLRIGANAFYSKSITSVVIPDTVTTIEQCAFQFCDDLAAITFGNGVEFIGDYAFYECTSLRSLVLPQSLKTIRMDALVCSSSLKYLFVPQSVTTIQEEGIGFRRVFVFVNDDDPYTKPITGFTVYGYPGTAAEDYATANGFAFCDVTAAYSAGSMGASLRTNTPGLRFGFDIAANDSVPFDKVYSYELGFLYSYSEDRASLTLDNVGTNGVKSRKATNVNAGDSNISYNLVFTNIPKSAYTTCISARAYAIINGEVFYSRASTYSVRDIADLVMEDEDVSPDVKQNIRDTFGI